MNNSHKLPHLSSLLSKFGELPVQAAGIGQPYCSRTFHKKLSISGSRPIRVALYHVFLAE